MPRPITSPLGLELANAAKRVSAAFDAALAVAGGSRPVWLILLTIKARAIANQQEIADAVGVRGATLTYHLKAMEADGLLTRRREEHNLRAHVVELTEAGDQAFHAMRAAAMMLDLRRRTGLTDKDVDQLRSVLRVLSDNVASDR
jgi:MarR family transcriptional regulator, transcriptional regulator for hemolysin